MGKSGYQAPSGGGGATSSYSMGDSTVTFGHGGRHLDGTNLSCDQVERSIASDVGNHNILSTHSQTFNINVDGINLAYRAIERSEKHIHVGTYFVVD